MRIIFLQNTIDAQGGIITVNRTLAQAFQAQGDQVFFVSLRHAVIRSSVDYPAPSEVINDAREWSCPRLREAWALLRKGKLFRGLQLLGRRISYDHSLHRDYRACRARLLQLRPDIIINSHYELLDCIPHSLLSHTINHFHTSFGQVRQLRSYQKIFKRYRNKLGKFVWLSKASCAEAQKFGLLNSLCIYNPLSFQSSESADLCNHRALFLGRFSPEKRLDLAIQLFQQAASSVQAEDWKLDIYGIGELTPALQQQIKQDPRITYCGSTTTPQKILLQHSIFLLTSSFEGMPLVVLEAGACGVPTIAFDFGETAPEVLHDRSTGLLLPAGAEDAYVSALAALMENEALRKKLGANAKVFSENFEIERILSRWNQLFAQICQEE